MNPLEAIKNMLSGMTPEQYVMNLAKSNTNPVLSNLIQMAQKGDTKGVEQFAKNLFREQGKDFDNFMKNLK